MAKPIQRGAEMLNLKRQMPFTSTPKDETKEGTSTSSDHSDAIFTIIVLLLACLALALLADAVI